MDRRDTEAVSCHQAVSCHAQFPVNPGKRDGDDGAAAGMYGCAGEPVLPAGGLLCRVSCPDRLPCLSH